MQTRAIHGKGNSKLVLEKAVEQEALLLMNAE